MRQVLTVWMAAAVLALSQPAQAQAQDRTEWIVAGSGTNILLTQTLAGAFMEKHPGISIKVLPSIGTTGGIRSVHKGKIMLGLASRPLKGLEQTWNLKVTPYARTALVFGANPSVPDDNLSAQDVMDLYSGKRSKWSNGRKIVVLLREEGDSGAEVLMKALEGFKDILENAWRSGMWRIEYRDAECNKSIERIKDAVGWTDIGSVQLGNHNIKLLKFNGVSPAAETLISGRYPLYKELSFVYREPLPEPLMQFVAFVKSREGAELVRKNGYVTVP